VASNWTRVSARLAEALELESPARDRFLADLAASDPETAAEVRALVAAHGRAGSFLEQPAWAADPDLLSDAPLVGRTIGPYVVRHVIGRGGMGVVYAADDTRLGRSVALKALPEEVRRDPVARERLAREARAAAQLSHPSIATVYALEEVDGEVFIASELVRGRTLRAELASGPLGADRLLPTLVQIAEALDAAHRQGIVHRDLKPENVLRDAEGRVKVVDFGLARSVTPSPAPGLTATGAALGTPGYMAPEQLRGERADARADVFAFGVIAYELATGRHPFGGSDPAALLERLLSDDPALRTLTPPPLDALVRRCLRGAPALRFESGADLLAALHAIEGPATPLPLPRAAWWWQFHQGAVTALIVAALVVLGLRRHWIDPYGSAAFMVALVLATIAVTLRMHMLFVSLVHPAALLALRRRVLRWVVLCESLFVIVLMAVGSALAGPHDGTAAQMVVAALLVLLSLVVIEPATTRAALES
jgi:serine/threonine protein kinase